MNVRCCQPDWWLCMCNCPRVLLLLNQSLNCVCVCHVFQLILPNNRPVVGHLMSMWHLLVNHHRIWYMTPMPFHHNSLPHRQTRMVLFSVALWKLRFIFRWWMFLCKCLICEYNTKNMPDFQSIFYSQRVKIIQGVKGMTGGLGRVVEVLLWIIATKKEERWIQNLELIPMYKYIKIKIIAEKNYNQRSTNKPLTINCAE